MHRNNLSAILYGINDLRLEETEVGKPNDNEVLLKMACIGICGSDVHYLTKGKIGDFILEKPMIIGHESSGTVIEIGRNVRNLEIGDRVAVEPGIPCRFCKYCKQGRYNLCRDMEFCATPPINGSLRRFYKHAADFCHKLQENVSLEEGALAEPLSVGVHACKRAGITIGSNVLILGAGPVGLLTLLVAKALGAKTVILSDLNQHRLSLAEKMGADATYVVDKHSSETENVKNIRICFNEPPDVTIDASGAEDSIRLSILVTRAGGVVVIVGMGAPEVRIPLMDALVREVDIRGVFRYVNDYSDALDLISTKKADVRAIVTHRYKLEETLEAFETAKSSQSGAIKVMIYCE
uniref:Sorbitol dehydrogenase n=1 Tax=Aphelinus abdominalis TaxID=297830 RepID=A0A481SZX2_9HYME|nr:alcohol dehydrogenase [Aphelinus abdominalis]